VDVAIEMHGSPVILIPFQNREVEQNQPLPVNSKDMVILYPLKVTLVRFKTFQSLSKISPM